MASTEAAVTSIGFIGLGAMGFGMASNLSNKTQYRVTGYDVFAPSMQRFVQAGGVVGESPKKIAKKSEFLICMATNSQQINSILFNDEIGALKCKTDIRSKAEQKKKIRYMIRIAQEANLSTALPISATILVCSTVSPTYYEALQSRVAEAGRPDVMLMDCPVSGGTTRAAAGTLTIFASGEPNAVEKADSLLHDMSEKLYLIPGGVGAASKVKMINQLLVGAHIAAAAEAMALATKAGLNTREVYNIIVNAAGNSWAFENRVPHMLDGDWTPYSALDIFVKDMVCCDPYFFADPVN